MDAPKTVVFGCVYSGEEDALCIRANARNFLTACLATYRSGCSSRPCAMCVGNKAAIDSLVKGSSSSSAIGAILVNLFWGAADRRPVVWRLAYVGAKSNAADPPSRMRDAPMGSSCARPSGEIAPEFARTSSSRTVPLRDHTLSNKRTDIAFRRAGSYWGVLAHGPPLSSSL